MSTATGFSLSICALCADRCGTQCQYNNCDKRIYRLTECPAGYTNELMSAIESEIEHIMTTGKHTDFLKQDWGNPKTATANI